jgi:hypothetical protein
MGDVLKVDIQSVEQNIEEQVFDALFLGSLRNLKWKEVKSLCDYCLNGMTPGSGTIPLTFGFISEK